MSRRTKQVGAILAIVAMFLFSWPIWKLIYIRPVDAAVEQRTKGLIEKNPQLQPAWEQALHDGVLTRSEAKAIVEQAGEKLDD